MIGAGDRKIIQIEWTNKCELQCSHCTRSTAHQPHRWDMTTGQLEAALRSMQGWTGANGIALLGAMGGNPLLHKSFPEMCRIFMANWGGKGKLPNGRGPILDFPMYAQSRLGDASSGRGIWTNLGPKFYQHLEIIHETFSWWNVNTHENDGLHHAMFIHRDDYNRLNNQTDDQWLANRDHCALQREWSSTINPHGAYFCEVAATIDDLFYEGKSAWPVEAGWWKRQPDDFQSQLHLCNHCSLAQKVPDAVNRDERDIISQTNLIQLGRIGSPAVRKEKYELYDPIHNPEHRPSGRNWRIDGYVPGDNPREQAEQRIRPTNQDARPKKLSAVVACVGYADKLALTLPYNLKLVDELLVVTTTTDLETRETVLSLMDYNDKISLIYSDRCYDNAASFNKGAMLNDGLRAIEAPDWIIFTDADVFLSPLLPSLMHDAVLNPGCLYFTNRLDIPAASIPRWQAGQYFDYAAIPSGKNNEPSGYFQLFNRRAAAIAEQWPNAVSEMFPSAGGLDTHFYSQWDLRKVIHLPQLSVHHIEHSRSRLQALNGIVPPGTLINHEHRQSFGQNWNGFGEKEPGKWRQLGMVSRNSGMLIFASEQRPSMAGFEFRVIRMNGGQSAEFVMAADDMIPIDIIDMQAPEAPGAKPTLLFCGTDVKDECLYLAYREPILANN